MHEQILEALRGGDHAAALAAACAAVEADGHDARAHHLLAMAQRAGGDADAALASIDRAIALAPDDPALHFQRAGFLIGARQIDRAQQDLARTIALDPNSFGAYLVQAELAVGRGDVDEAERIARIAARIAPDHPALAAVAGMVALRRGDPDRALSVLSAAQSRGGNDPQLLNALGFAYLAKGHLAFAEQTFRRMREAGLGGAAQQRMLAEIVHRQGRHQEAMEELQPLLGEGAAPAHMAFAGQLELAMARPGRALPWLRRALAANPAAPRTLSLIMAAWQRLGDIDDARNTLDAALATSPRLPQLWQARAALERGDLERERAVVARWLAAAPDAVPALEARLALLGPDDAGAAEETARRIVELEPGHLVAEARLLDLLARRDPQAAVRRAEELQRLPSDERLQRLVRGWLAVANDAAGQHARAAQLWAALHDEAGERMIPLPEWSAPDAPRSPAAAPTGSAPAVVLMAGLPGAGVERLGQLLDGIVPAFRADRFGARPPDDPLQNVRTVPALARGETDPGEVARAWSAQLPARGIAGGAVIDWLLWWDNALLDVFAPHVPQARLLLALRDPRDMLINWLAFGAPVPLRMGSPRQAAEWLARGLEHIAQLHERDLHPHRLLRIDDAVNDPPALAGPLGAALGLELPVPPAGLFAGRRFPAGHWRAYATALAEPFAALTPVAIRLGYPET
ncbi:tetratricopeptide repeat protein [Luteimonas sp. RD2P54]|uniref:Tetratricopeptide repeat protein n=1 Tax=Luteimonas endophytica TaxID=3042023 RepID=A0ABT6J8Y5_9GAMM|nr:tetratricopeptide repeat protein [Luteimonas endophytica]MDH5823281.1 tetratricopeptide repeat protein [Luteimonas endophytica]